MFPLQHIAESRPARTAPGLIVQRATGTAAVYPEAPRTEPFAQVDNYRDRIGAAVDRLFGWLHDLVSARLDEADRQSLRQDREAVMIPRARRVDRAELWITRSHKHRPAGTRAAHGNALCPSASAPARATGRIGCGRHGGTVRPHVFDHDECRVDQRRFYFDHGGDEHREPARTFETSEVLRRDDALVIWKLDPHDRDLRHLVTTVGYLTARGISLKVLAGEGASMDPTTANGRLIFAIFAGLAEFERGLIVERTRAGLESACARGRHGGRPFKMTPAKLRLAQAAMGKPETKVAELRAELGVTRQPLYRHVTSRGEIRPDGEKPLASRISRRV